MNIILSQSSPIRHRLITFCTIARVVRSRNKIRAYGENVQNFAHCAARNLDNRGF